MIFYILFYALIFFYLAWPLNTLWRRITNKPDPRNFYYQQSFRVIFMITFFAALFLNLFLALKSAIV